MPPISGLAGAAGAGGRVVADFISLASIRRANLCQRLYAFDGRAVSDEAVRPLAAVTFLVVAAAVFQLLLSVLELGKLTLLGGDFSFQLRDGFLFGHGI